MPKAKKRDRVFIDDCGHVTVARTVRELRERLGGKVSKMYRDKPDGSIVHVGYVVGPHWLTEYRRVERPA